MTASPFDPHLVHILDRFIFRQNFRSRFAPRETIKCFSFCFNLSRLHSSIQNASNKLNSAHRSYVKSIMYTVTGRAIIKISCCLICWAAPNVFTEKSNGHFHWDTHILSIQATFNWFTFNHMFSTNRIEIDWTKSRRYHFFFTMAFSPLVSRTLIWPPHFTILTNCLTSRTNSEECRVQIFGVSFKLRCEYFNCLE